MKNPIVVIDGRAFRAFPQHGAFFGIMPRTTGKPVLLCVAMLDDGEPDRSEHSIIEVSCIEDDDTCLADVNAAFGTDYIQADFFGR